MSVDECLSFVDCGQVFSGRTSLLQQPIYNVIGLTATSILDLGALSVKFESRISPHCVFLSELRLDCRIYLAQFDWRISFFQFLRCLSVLGCQCFAVSTPRGIYDEKDINVIYRSLGILASIQNNHLLAKTF